MLTCNDGTWDSIISVDDSFTNAFLTGGPMGFSCDILNIPDEYKTKWKNLISEYKCNRDFFASAAARVLVDTNGVVVIHLDNLVGVHTRYHANGSEYDYEKFFHSDC